MAGDDGTIEKMERDFTHEVDQVISECKKILKKSNLNEVLEKLQSLEKQTRLGCDSVSTGRLLVFIVEICAELGEWKVLTDQLNVLSKKRAQLKQPIAKMVQSAMEKLSKTPNLEIKLELINTLRGVTEGKIFVEVERARLTRMLSQFKEKEGKINEAADILHELQIETFGSMDKREKVEFILEQIRLGLAKKDYVRTQIISRKINAKFLNQEDNEDLKLGFHRLMIELALTSNSYMEICKSFMQIYGTKFVSSDESQWKEVLRNVAIFVVLSPFDNEQSDLLHKVFSDKKLSLLPIYKELLNCFITKELVRWPKVEEVFKHELATSLYFQLGSDSGKKRWSDLRNRVIEHNIRVISEYYTRISFSRLTQLLDLNLKETEDYISSLVVKKTIYARIDRLAGVVSFTKPSHPHEAMNSWSFNLNSLLDLIVKTNHLISKEEMIHQLSVTNKE